MELVYGPKIPIYMIRNHKLRELVVINLCSVTDAFYQHMLQEYKKMLSRIEGGYIRRSCINACDESVENKQRSADECQCDRHCVQFRDCCLDYWQR